MATSLIEQAPALAEAWARTRGAGVVVAVVDDAVEVQGHPEFEGRVLDGCAAGSELVAGRWRPHGAKVAGLAVGGGSYIRGMAPEALLLPVAVPALMRGTGDISEAEGIQWAADHGADVICCAWAPPDPARLGGKLPEHTRHALDSALTRGRGGKGCAVVFSAGNDDTDLSRNGYASYPGVIAVGACSRDGRRVAYSGWGEALWCVFPSNDPADPVGRTQTYLTTAPPRSFELGQTWYTRSFGFTSAACAAVAGLCALIVSANPALTALEVREVLRESCEKVDLAGGSYDHRGHSPFYGFGLPQPDRAVTLAYGKSSSRSV